MVYILGIPALEVRKIESSRPTWGYLRSYLKNKNKNQKNEGQITQWVNMCVAKLDLMT